MAAISNIFSSIWRNAVSAKQRKGDLSPSLRIADVVPLGRKSVEDFGTDFGRRGLFSTIPRQFLEYHKYDLTDLSKLNSTDIIRLMCYIEPNVSHAISNYLRVFDSGSFLTASDSKGKTHAQAEDYLNELVRRLNNPEGNFFNADTSVSRFVLQLALHELIDGALAAEVEFSRDYSRVELHNIDPATIQFKAGSDGRLVPYQVGLLGEVTLDYPTVFYIPVDSIANDPYGTNQILSAIQPVMSKFRLLQDFSRVLRNLGFDRLDISLSLEKIMEHCKNLQIREPDKILTEMNRILTEAKTSFKNLEVDDNPVHFDVSTLGTLEGKNASKGIDVQAVVNVLLAEIASGLKTYATILGKRFGGSTEGYTSVEGLLFIRLIIGFQAIAKRILDRIFTLILRAGGIQAYASWEWLEPSLRLDYESAQYYAAYELLLFEAEKLGSISTAEFDARMRKMLRFKGPPPADAKRDPDFSPQGKNNPQRDTSQEEGKEAKRKETNRERRSTGGGQK